METLNRQGTANTPKVILDKANGIFEISGRSLPEDAPAFYGPVVDWIKSYAVDSNDTTNFTFKLEYFNTGSSKMILDILTALQKVAGTRVFWCFHDDEEDMEEAGQEFAELVNIPFQFEVY